VFFREMRLISLLFRCLLCIVLSAQINSLKNEYKEKSSYINVNEFNNVLATTEQHKHCTQSEAEHEVKFNQITQDYKKCIHTLGITQDELQSVTQKIQTLKDNYQISKSSLEQQTNIWTDNLSKLTAEMTRYQNLYDTTLRKYQETQNYLSKKEEDFEQMTILTNQLATVTSDLTRYKKLYEHTLKEHHGTIQKNSDLQAELSKTEKKLSTMYINVHIIIRDFNIFSSRLINEWNHWYVYYFQPTIASQLYAVKQRVELWEEITQPNVAKITTLIKKHIDPVISHVTVKLISLYENYCADMAEKYLFVPWLDYCAPITNQLFDFIQSTRVLMISILKKSSKSAMIYMELMEDNQLVPFHRKIYECLDYLNTHADDFFTWSSKHFHWLISIFVIWFVLPIIGKVFYILFLFASIYMPVQVFRQYTQKK